MRLPTPRDLKEPDGWRFSSLRKMRQPAALERAEDSMRGVEIHGVGRSGEAMVADSVRVIFLEKCCTLTVVCMYIMYRRDYGSRL